MVDMVDMVDMVNMVDMVGDIFQSISIIFPICTSSRYSCSNSPFATPCIFGATGLILVSRFEAKNMMQELRMTEVKDCQQLEASWNGAEDWGSIEIAGWGWRIYGDTRSGK